MTGSSISSLASTSLCGGAMKRLAKELAEIEADADQQQQQQQQQQQPFSIHTVDDDFLLWHFTLRGPEDSEYSGGEYHGKIVFPSDYPFSPPSVVFLTPNGRFDVNVKICLSFTGYHPEHWQPAWGVRTMLLALREHFRAEDKASIGYLGFSRGDRLRAAARSHQYTCSVCGYNMDKSAASRAERRCQVNQGAVLVGIIVGAILFCMLLQADG